MQNLINWTGFQGVLECLLSNFEQWNVKVWAGMCQQGYTAGTWEVYLTIENVHVSYNWKRNPVESSLKYEHYDSRIHGVRIRSVKGLDVKLEMSSPFWMTEIKKCDVWCEHETCSELALYVVSASPLWPTTVKNLKFDHYSQLHENTVQQDDNSNCRYEVCNENRSKSSRAHLCQPTEFKTMEMQITLSKWWRDDQWFENSD